MRSRCGRSSPPPSKSLSAGKGYDRRKPQHQRVVLAAADSDTRSAQAPTGCLRKVPSTQPRSSQVESRPSAEVGHLGDLSEETFCGVLGPRGESRHAENEEAIDRSGRARDSTTATRTVNARVHRTRNTSSISRWVLLRGVYSKPYNLAAFSQVILRRCFSFSCPRVSWIVSWESGNTPSRWG